MAIDPETGELEAPSPEQARALSSAIGEAVSRSPGGLIEIHRPDGAVGLDLQGRFQDYTWVRIGPNGKPIFGCLHSDRQATPALTDSFAALPAPEEE